MILEGVLPPTTPPTLRFHSFVICMIVCDLMQTNYLPLFLSCMLTNMLVSLVAISSFILFAGGEWGGYPP